MTIKGMFVSKTTGSGLALSSDLYSARIGYVAIHLGMLGIFFAGDWRQGLLLAVITAQLRTLGVSMGYHRYFAHRAFKTSRLFQFLLAVYGTLSAQGGLLWWAQTHRHHHRYSDTPLDLHSPRHHGFWYSHSGWFLSRKNRGRDLNVVSDLAKYPELIWLNDWGFLLVLLYVIGLYAWWGWHGVVWGFCVSTVLLWHATHLVQSVCHSFGGYRRFDTPDDSRNHLWISLITWGDGYQNNHHHRASSARQGFAWWEIDPCYYVLLGLRRLGIVWDLNDPASKELGAPG